MTLKLYNTLTRTKEEFKPLDPKNVRMYVCGPTVYDYAHIGNARPVIVFDVLFRLLRHLYGAEHVTYVRNITDIDDKINKRAKDEGVPIRDLTERTAKQFHDDIAALGVLPPTHEPRATDSIPQMIALIERLIASGHAYTAEGHVLFHVPSMRDYGRLSRRSLDDMIAGARVDVAPYKRDPMDFVLWKPSDAETPGWDSPWGRGRPGWHIECSAMSWKLLGEVFDIHGGGIDLIFPHHENEIAQSLCAFGTTQMAKVWMHNGFLQVKGQKMSKSFGNFVTIRDQLKYDSGEKIRLAMLMTNYTQPINWTQDRLSQAYDWLQNWYRSVPDNTIASEPFNEVVEAIKDDLNTWEAFSFMNEVLAERKKLISSTKANKEWYSWKAARFKASANLLGFMNRSFDNFKAELDALQLTYELEALPGTREFIEKKIEDRKRARMSKNWAESDRIRHELAAMGVILKDNKDGTTTWEVKR